MHITQDNYEQFFLDHAEGNLSPEMEKELDDFLEANPDLKMVLEDFDPSPIKTVEMRNDILKVRLKKHLHPTDHIREDNIDEWMIGDVEGQLNDSQENELKEFLVLNPAYTFDYKIFGYTKLSPDLSVTYRWKNELKKKAFYFPVRRLAWLLPAAAAVILLFIGVRFLMKPEIQPVHPVILPIAEIPRISSTGTDANLAIPVMEQKGTPSQDHPVQITRGKTSRLNSISVKEVDLPDQTESASLNLADFHFYPILTAEKKDRSLFAKVFNNMVAQAREGLSRSTNLEKGRKTDFNIWSIAKAGINGYNSISDRELELYVRKDEDGKVKSYALVDQERLIMSKELNKN